MPRIRPSWLVVPALLAVAILFIYPVLGMVIKSFTEGDGGIGNYQAVFDSSATLTILLRSVGVAALATVISLAVGYPYAYLAASASPRTGALLIGVMATSIFISVVVRGYAWLALLDREGAVNALLGAFGVGPVELVRNFTGVMIAMVQFGIPLMTLPIYDVMRRVDHRLTYAASTLGASPRRAFVHVYLPLTMPGVAAGCSIVFASTIGYYILPSILGGPQNVMVGELISRLMLTTLEWGQATALGAVLLVVTLTCFITIVRSIRRPGGQAAQR